MIVGKTVLSTRPDIRRGFILSAAMYLTGVFGFEGLGGWWNERHGIGPTYAALVTVEESLEIAGLSLLIRTLVRLLSVEAGGFTLHLGTKV